MDHPLATEVMDDWSAVCQALPPGWEEAAAHQGAMRRMRGFADAPALLRVLLVHLAGGCSLRESALRARRAGWCNVSAVALIKRLRSCEQWLRWMAQELRPAGDARAVLPQRRLRVVDATTVQEPGATGTDWRLHFVLRLEDLQCDHYELTDASQGEKFGRVPVREGDLLMGDRLYATPTGVAYARSRGADVLARMTVKNLPLFDASGEPIRLMSLLRQARTGRAKAWPATVRRQGQGYPGRLVAVKRTARACEKARKRVRRIASRNSREPSRASLEAARYVFVWTSLPEELADAAKVMELYRLRWQVEMAFKRIKSVLGLGHLPKRSDASARAWIHGKMLVALLVEKLRAQAEAFSPWGGLPPRPTQPLARDGLHGPRTGRGGHAPGRPAPEPA